METSATFFNVTPTFDFVFDLIFGLVNVISFGLFIIFFDDVKGISMLLFLLVATFLFDVWAVEVCFLVCTFSTLLLETTFFLGVAFLL